MLYHEIVGSGPPILLIPGLLGTIDTELKDLMQPIADLGYQVIAVDLPGHGKSEMTKSVSMRVMVEEIETLLTEIKSDPVVIFGFSAGGYAALSFALKRPNRVVAVWMHGTKFYWSGAEADEMAEDLDVAYLEENNPERLARLRELHGEKLEELLPWLAKAVTNMPDIGLTEMDLEEFKLPVMISVGDHDELVPVTEAVQLCDSIENGQLAVFPDTNHPLGSLRDHVFLPMLKDFLNRLD